MVTYLYITIYTIRILHKKNPNMHYCMFDLCAQRGKVHVSAFSSKSHYD